MFDPDFDVLVEQAKDRFIRSLFSKASETADQDVVNSLPPGLRDDIDKMKVVIKYVQFVIPDMMNEYHNQLMEKLRAKGIEL